VSGACSRLFHDYEDLEGVVKYIPLSPIQAAFRDSPALYRAFVGGRGAGKSRVGAYDLIRKAEPGRKYLVGSPTGILMGDTTYPTFKETAEALGVWHGVKLSPYPTAKIRVKGGTAEIRFRTAEDPEKMRGPNLAGCWLDEASLMHEDAYKINIAALREGGVAGALGEQGFLTATFTPKGPTHWTYDTFAKGKPNTEIFRAKTSDNPFLPPSFEETLYQQYGDTQFARQELGGEFVSLLGAEFPAEWFEWPNDGIWFNDWPADAVFRVVFLDPSKGVHDNQGNVKKAKDGDWQCYVMAALYRERDIQGKQRWAIYLDASFKRETPQEMIGRGLGICRDFRPQVVWFEDNGTMGFMGPEIRRQVLASDTLVPWMAKVNHVPKIQRIRTLGGPLSLRQIRLRNTVGGKLLRAQLGDVPFGEYDDGPDAAAGAIEVLGQLLNPA
jgi:phage terminase large subunit-like protein